MSSQSWMSPRTNRTGSSPLSLSLRWGFRTIKQCSWYFPYVFPTKSIHASFAAAIITWVNLVAGQTGLLGLPQVHLHRLPQVPGQPVASWGQSHHCLWRVDNRWYFGPFWYTLGIYGCSMFTALLTLHITNLRRREDTFWVKVSWGGHKKSKAKAQVSQAGTLDVN